MTDNTAGSRLGWLMNDLVERVVGVRHAILLSVDGLLMARSEGLPRADAEHLSAVGSAFRSLSHGAGRRFGLGGVRQTVVELETAYLLVAEAGPHACLALLVDEAADLGLIGYEMNRVVHQAGQHLTSPPRAAATSARAQ